MSMRSTVLVGSPAAVQWPSGARVLRRASIASMIMVAAGIVLWVAVPSLRGRDVAAVGVTGLLLGIPHGAVDHVLPPAGSWPIRPGPLSRLLGLYLLAFAVMLAIVFASPVIAYWALVVLAVFHWGVGDAVVRRERRGEATGIGGPAEILAYGGFIVVSLAAWPDHVRVILAAVAPGVADETRLPTLAAGYLMAAAMVAFSARMLLRRRWLEAGEVAVLLALAIATPPLVAFGLYFGPWHAVRQTTRLFLEAGRTDSAPGAALGPAIGPIRLLRMMVFGTVAAFAVILVVEALSGMYPDRAQQFGGNDWAMATLTAAVAPHVVTVLRYDLWKIRSSRKGAMRASFAA
jgi:Brp/Blh family beta-carotene 15,15'-monooxygenase